MTKEEFERKARSTIHVIHTRDLNIIRQEIRDRAMRNILKPVALRVEEIPEDQLQYVMDCRVGIHRYNVSVTTTREEHPRIRRWHTSLNFFNQKDEPIEPSLSLVNEVLWIIYGTAINRVKHQGSEYETKIGKKKKVLHYEMVLNSREPWEFWERERG